MTSPTTNKTTTSDLGFGIFDADEHYYEPVDALTRHLPKHLRRAVKWADVEGRQTMILNNKLVTVVPNPTYDPVGAPGSIETYFRAENHDGVELRDMVKMQPIQPEYRERDARLARMDQQGVEFTWLIPSLGLGIEEMLWDDPPTLHAIFEAYNRWLDDDWGYDRDGRIQTGPMISLVDPVAAEAELNRIIDLGARMIVMRPAPVGVLGRPRSLGDPAHDRVWARCAEAGVVVSFHAADSGYGKYKVDWGDGDGYSGLKQSTFEEVLSLHIERPVFDTFASLICHGVLERHPTLRFASLELGAAWVPWLIRRLKSSYGKTPQQFGRDPVESFHDQVWVAPFYEDDVSVTLAALGADRMMLGSDWPHPEGLPHPAKAAQDFAVLGDDVVRRVMRDNLAGLVAKP
jgi:predicted TIM-barrel fold metal-dependent hydrolase